MNQVRTAVKQVVETIGSVAGIRVGTEEPLYTAQPLIDNVELRRYGTRIAAQTAVAAEEAARNEGFRRLARYIFGANHARQKIARPRPSASRPRQPAAGRSPRPHRWRSDARATGAG